MYDNENMAKAFADRDDEYANQSGETLAEWRAKIDGLLAAGPPYGKIVFDYDHLEDKFEIWRQRLLNVPPEAGRLAVYECAPEAALSFLGY